MNVLQLCTFILLQMHVFYFFRKLKYSYIYHKAFSVIKYSKYQQLHQIYNI